MPDDFVSVLKTQTRKLSLSTKGLAEARKRLWPIVVEWQREFEDLRTRRALTGADREHAVRDHYTAVLERDDTERTQIPSAANIEAIRGELIAHDVDDYLRVNRLFVERSTPDWISLLRHMMRAENDALERSLERDEGDFAGRPRDPLVKPPM